MEQNIKDFKIDDLIGFRSKYYKFVKYIKDSSKEYYVHAKDSNKKVLIFIGDEIFNHSLAQRDYKKEERMTQEIMDFKINDTVTNYCNSFKILGFCTATSTSEMFNNIEEVKIDNKKNIYLQIEEGAWIPITSIFNESLEERNNNGKENTMKQNIIDFKIMDTIIYNDNNYSIMCFGENTDIFEAVPTIEEIDNKNNIYIFVAGNEKDMCVFKSQDVFNHSLDRRNKKDKKMKFDDFRKDDIVSHGEDFFKIDGFLMDDFGMHICVKDSEEYIYEFYEKDLINHTLVDRIKNKEKKNKENRFYKLDDIKNPNKLISYHFKGKLNLRKLKKDNENQNWFIIVGDINSIVFKKDIKGWCNITETATGEFIYCTDVSGCIIGFEGCIISKEDTNYWIQKMKNEEPFEVSSKSIKNVICG